MCPTKPSVVYANAFAPDTVSDTSSASCYGYSPAYLGAEPSSVLPSCSACGGCSAVADLSVWNLRPVNASVVTCEGAGGGHTPLQMALNPLTTMSGATALGVAESRYKYGAKMPCGSTGALGAAAPGHGTGHTIPGHGAANYAPSYGTILPTSFLQSADAFQAFPRNGY